MSTADTSLAPVLDVRDRPAQDGNLRAMANAIRALSMDAVQKANSGHPGMPMGMADVATVLFSRFLTFDPEHPDWADRDRFLLSAGHGSMLLYSLLYLTGYPDMTLDDLKAFRQIGARTAGHPEYGHSSGIETTTGPLGQGLANGVGMALAERLLEAQFGRELVDHHIYVLAGDGCLMEGISHEAASMAGHLGLGRLVVLFDDNKISIDGSTALALSDDVLKRFEALNWHVLRIDGHDQAAIERALIEAKSEIDRPSLIACETMIGYGSPNKQGTSATHGAPLGDSEIKATREQLGWPHAPFEIPEMVLAAWRAAGARGRDRHAAWSERLAAADPSTRAEFERRTEGRLPEGWQAVVDGFKAKISAEAPKAATRTSSQDVLEVLTAAVPELLGGSADLTGSNNTKTKATAPVGPASFAGRYIHYGVREHGMAAAMNGIALHGGLIPYGGTFLCFSDYNRPSIRLAALMGVRVVHVLTHDSIGLGEDGPTHQPVEHLASLRAIPGLWVFRPADGVETAEAWALAVARADGPSALALSRQNLPTLRAEHTTENLSARGAYVLHEAMGKRDVTLLATGSELHLAVEARERLAADGIRAAVVSMPCWELFETQDRAYRRAVLGDAPRVAIEAALPFGWTRYVESEADVVGMVGFGASGKAEDLYAQFGITAEALADRARRHVRAPAGIPA
ncbi:transketolase [Marinivivus vitaminiproducens]|uniref:transketolase n=1 Tax=Marinivivus vitaminiproducens TaxID=3035935 RepID=UPI00279C1CBD|nr:transketolase [Geminicoccaceae bacterium SCSIO 64248]